MSFKLIDLPYGLDSLDPVISKRTMEHHYLKHHAGYVDKLNAALPDSDRSKSLEQVIMDAHAAKDARVFNSAAQIWNHDFYWLSLSPTPVSCDDGRLSALIGKSGGLDSVKNALKEAALGQFGSGWAWLLYNSAEDALEITSTSDAETPVTGDKTALLTIDVWEHAYYLDHQQDRAGYVDGVLEQLNWQFAAENLPV